MDGFRNFRFWPRTWRGLDYEPERAEIFQLYEAGLPSAHPLHGSLRDAVAYRDGDDVALFELKDGRIAELSHSIGAPDTVYETIWAWIDAVEERLRIDEGVER